MRKGIRYISVILMTFFAVTVSLQSKAQTPSTANQVKAVFIYNFTRFVEWPPNSFNSNTSPFVIGILGRDPFGSYMESVVEGETVGLHPIVVQRFSNVNEIKNCQILFINTSEPYSTIKDLKNRSILTVGDQDNFARQGGMVRFFIQNSKIRLQINLKAAKAADLTISSKLLRVADVID